MVIYGNSCLTTKRNRTMKKTYQNPEIKIVKVQIAQLMAGSNPEGFNGGLGGDSEGGNGDEGLSRRFGGSLWDDDDEY